MSDATRECNNIVVLTGMRNTFPKKYDGIEAIAAKQAVASWLKSLREGQSRRRGLYSLARYLR